MVAENLRLKQQLIILNRSRKRAPQTSSSHRLLFGFLCHFLDPRRIQRAAVAFRPSTFLRFHAAFRNRKYRLLHSPGKRSRPGPKGPNAKVIQAILEFKRRNPRFGCPRIAQQITAAFGIDIDKDIVRRVLASHFKPQPNDNGPSWLSFLGHTKDSLWSMDLFRTESIRLQTHWVLVVMDQYSRRIIGFAVQPITVEGPALCRMFNRIISKSNLPERLSFANLPRAAVFYGEPSLALRAGGGRRALRRRRLPRQSLVVLLEELLVALRKLAPEALQGLGALAVLQETPDLRGVSGGHAVQAEISTSVGKTGLLCRTGPSVSPRRTAAAG